jgi:hypothetical protein
MATGDNIGEVQVLIQGDWSDLQSAIDQAAAASQAGAQEISDAFNTAATGATPPVEHLGEATKTAGAEAEHAGESFGGLGEKLVTLAEFAGIATTMYGLAEALKEFTLEAINTSANIEFISAALTDMTHSAEVTRNMLEQIEGIASRSIFSFPELAKTAQNMTYLGIEAEKIPPILTDLANLAEHAGTSVDAMSSAFDRAWLTGQVGPRIFKALGVGAQEFADVMGVATGAVVADFKALGPESEDALEVLRLVIAKKSLEMGTGLENTFKVHLNAAAVQWEEFSKNVGDLLKPLAEFIIEWGSKALGLLLQDMTLLAIGAKATAQTLAGDFAGAAVTVTKGTLDLAASQAKVNEEIQKGKLSIEEQKKALDDQIAALQKKLGVDIAGAEAEKAKQQLTVTTIAQLKELGQLGAEDPFKTLDASGQKLFDDFQRGFQGIYDGWNEAAAGIKPDKLVTDLEKLRAEMVQDFATDTLGYIQVTDAIKILDDWMLNHIVPDASAVGDHTEKATAQAIQGFDKLGAKINKETKPFVDEFGTALKNLGLTGEDATVKMTKSLDGFQVLLNSHISTVSTLQEGWNRVESQVKTMANDPDGMAKLISLGDQYVQRLQSMGGAQGQIYTAEQQVLQLEIQMASERGENATAQIIQLEEVRRAQQLLIDQSQLMGQLYVSLMHTFDDAFKQLGKGIADNLIDAKNWGDVFTSITKNIARQILEDLVGTAFKALENAILKSTGLMQGMGNLFNSLFGGAASAARGMASSAGGAATSLVGDISQAGEITGEVGSAVSSGASAASTAASTTLSSVTGIIGAVGAVGTMVSSIIGNFQMAHQTNILRSIELNTRQTAMFIGGLGGGGVQDWLNIIAKNTTPLLDTDTWIHDSWVQQLDYLGQIRDELKRPPQINNFYISGASDPQAVATAVANYLKNTGSNFSP